MRRAMRRHVGKLAYLIAIAAGVAFVAVTATYPQFIPALATMSPRDRGAFQIVGALVVTVAVAFVEAIILALLRAKPRARKKSAKRRQV